MKKIALILLLLTVSFNYAQNTFQKGYIITNENKKTECFIKNEGWTNNPNQFKYKKTLDSPNLKADLNTVKEFGIENVFKYRRFEVEIDKSSSYTKKLTNFRYSVFEKEIVFLKLLVAGDAELYSYRRSELIRFFYKKKNSLKQLEYKKYLSPNNKVRENINYKKQLRDYFKCNVINTSQIDYDKKYLVRFFINYNLCKKSPNLINYAQKEKSKSKLNLYLNLGFSINNTNLQIPGSLNNIERNINFSGAVAFSTGIELEYIMPFNNNKWSVFIAPSYQTFQAETIVQHPFLTFQNSIYNFSYSALELPVGIRHYFFLNNLKKHKLFIDLGLATDFHFNTFLTEYNDSTEMTTETKASYLLQPNLFFSFGYVFNEKYKISLRYNESKQIYLESISNAPSIFYQSDLDSFSIALSYNFK
jgi:hypothetical protein